MQLAELEEVGDAPGLLERLVARLVLAEHAHVLPELLADRGDLRQRLREALFGARHTAVVPEDLAELAVDVVDGPLPVDRQHLADLLVHRLLGGLERGVVERQRLLAEERREVAVDRVRQHEVAVGQALHQRRRSEPVGALVGEVGFPEHEEAGHVAHQVVVDPQPAHRVVDGGVDAHRHDVRVSRR